MKQFCAIVIDEKASYMVLLSFPVPNHKLIIVLFNGLTRAFVEVLFNILGGQQI
jgi:hypothetical protein